MAGNAERLPVTVTIIVYLVFDKMVNNIIQDNSSLTAIVKTLMVLDTFILTPIQIMIIATNNSVLCN